jgi:hypothetical protein
MEAVATNFSSDIFDSGQLDASQLSTLPENMRLELIPFVIFDKEWGHKYSYYVTNHSKIYAEKYTDTFGSIIRFVVDHDKVSNVHYNIIRGTSY